MPAVVITNCTARKSAGAAVPPLPAAAWQSLDGACQQWTELVASVPAITTASQVYQGRSVREAESCAAALNADLWFVSVGLGLVRASDLIPRYDLTLVQGRHAIGAQLAALGTTPADWWHSLCSSRGLRLKALMDSCAGAPIYVALPSTYLELVAAELSEFAASRPDQALWIFTSEVGRALLPAALLPRALPYDRRLEASAYAGTQADFPQRSLRHFVDLGLPVDTSADQARTAVETSLARHKAPVRATRRVVTDEEALRLLRQHWLGQRGQSSRLLAHFRGELGVACEQSRFRQLFHQVRAEFQRKGVGS